ncbi:MAG TPA: sigma factor-like helix-turn-helix DNA-binding protein [Kofleriaceae bacterium]|nr:sigma factor-like helix-turn-helix DNA-binding protein [Kofleriaceae bacterium]
MSNTISFILGVVVGSLFTAAVMWRRMRREPRWSPMIPRIRAHSAQRALAAHTVYEWHQKLCDERRRWHASLLLLEAAERKAMARGDDDRLAAIHTLFIVWSLCPPKVLEPAYVEASIRNAVRRFKAMESKHTAYLLPDSAVIDTLASSGDTSYGRLLSELESIARNLPGAQTEALRLDLEGSSAKEIAEELNARGIRNEQGGEITHDTVRKWLSRIRKALAASAVTPV